MKYDFAQLKQNVDIVDVIGRKIDLKKKGTEYVGVCPWHADKDPSLHVNRAKQLFFCPVCGDRKGDAVDFLLAYGYTHKEAAEELHGGPLDKPAPERRALPKRAKPITWKQVTPGEYAPEPDFIHYKHGTPNFIWPYHDVSGRIIGYVCRFDTPDGKEVLPYIYAHNPVPNRYEWRWQAFDRPRPLFNLHLIDAATKAVIVVEGEKTASHLEKLFPVNASGEVTHAVTCWQGGTNAVQLTDFSPLHGKVVILWPDNDAVGRKAMSQIADQLVGNVPTLKYVHVPADLPKGWDGADIDWSGDDLRAWIREHMHDEVWKADEIASPAPEPEPQPEQEAEAKPEPPAKPRKQDPTDNNYFRVLGFETDDNGPVFVFFNKRLNCITRATPAQLTETFFGTLAPELFWRMTLGEDSKRAHMVQWVIEMCGNRQMFDESNIRGRGAWFDEGRAVLHCGDCLFVDGERVSLGDFRTKYIYEVGHTMDYDPCEPLSTERANLLLRALRKLGWERDVNADLLAGWCIVAPICGALDWRPHIWITGPAGTGKSWIFENIVSRVLGNTALRVQGETTEAGVRQSLGHDARPVVYDESEAEDKRGQDRLQAILTLMRGSSTSDGGRTVKGSAGGAARTYQIRSSFAFASINVPVSQQSDRSRLTILTLTKERALQGDEWDVYKQKCVEVISDEYINALRARTIRMIPTIKQNAKTFAKACAAVLGSQRSGDQAGALLAGAYALESDELITYEAAIERVKSHDWSEEKGLDATKDEARLLAHILEQVVRLDGGAERTIGELVMIAREFKQDHTVMDIEAEDKLRRIGLRTDDEFLIISNTAAELKKYLKDTPWSKEHHRILSRIKGAKRMETMRFAANSAKAVAVPLADLKPEGWTGPPPKSPLPIHKDYPF